MKVMVVLTDAEGIKSRRVANLSWLLSLIASYIKRGAILRIEVNSGGVICANKKGVRK